jgi:hypothetical protein
VQTLSKLLQEAETMIQPLPKDDHPDEENQHQTSPETDLRLVFTLDGEYEAELCRWEDDGGAIE